MDSKKFSAFEIDAIGEILNISLGASATAVSTMLSARVDITTPVVRVLSKEEFEISNLEPAVGVEITYIAGLSGSNIMLLKKHDVKVIVDMLMGMDTPEEEFQLNDLNISAICEVMNQMMGASATALSEFLGKGVNISTPQSFEIGDIEDFKKKYYSKNEQMVVVGFTLKIGDQMQSEFINVMPPDLARELVSGFFPDGNGEPAEQPQKEETPGGGMLSQEQIEEMLRANASAEAAAGREEAPAPQAEIPVPVHTEAFEDLRTGGNDEMNQIQAQMQQQQMMMAQMQQMMQQMQLMQAQPQPQANVKVPKTINVKPIPQNDLTAPEGISQEQEENRELIMGVPLEVSVEIGRARKLVKDILEFSKGSLVVLDKLAGDQVDLYVNGQCIAKGDVVVVDDNFGIRITEIVKRNIN